MVYVSVLRWSHVTRGHRHRAASSSRPPGAAFASLRPRPGRTCVSLFPRCQLRKALVCMLFVSQNPAFATSVRRGWWGVSRLERGRKEGRRSGRRVRLADSARSANHCVCLTPSLTCNRRDNCTRTHTSHAITVIPPLLLSHPQHLFDMAHTQT